MGLAWRLPLLSDDVPLAKAGAARVLLSLIRLSSSGDTLLVTKCVTSMLKNLATSYTKNMSVYLVQRQWSSVVPTWHVQTRVCPYKSYPGHLLAYLVDEGLVVNVKVQECTLPIHRHGCDCKWTTWKEGGRDGRRPNRRCETGSGARQSRAERDEMRTNFSIVRDEK